MGNDSGAGLLTEEAKASPDLVIILLLNRIFPESLESCIECDLKHV